MGMSLGQQQIITFFKMKYGDPGYARGHFLVHFPLCTPLPTHLALRHKLQLSTILARQQWLELTRGPRHSFYWLDGRQNKIMLLIILIN